MGRAKAVAEIEAERLGGAAPEKLTAILDKVGDGSALVKTTQFGSCVFANKPATAPPGTGGLLPEGAGGLCQHLL